MTITDGHTDIRNYGAAKLRSSKVVAREMGGSRQALGRLMEQLRSSLEYGYSMGRVWLEHLSVRRERTLGTSGVNSQSEGSGLRVLRYAAMIVLMMFLGVNSVWSITITYHIINLGRLDDSGQLTDTRTEALQFTSENPTVGIPDNYKSPLAKNWKYYKDGVTYTEETKSYTFDESTTLVEGEDELSDGDHVYVTYEFNEDALSTVGLYDGGVCRIKFPDNYYLKQSYWMNGNTKELNTASDNNNTNTSEFLWKFNIVDPYQITLQSQSQSDDNCFDYYLCSKLKNGIGNFGDIRLNETISGAKATDVWVFGLLNGGTEDTYRLVVTDGFINSPTNDNQLDSYGHGYLNNKRSGHKTTYQLYNKNSYAECDLTFEPLTKDYIIVNNSGESLVHATTTDYPLEVPDVIKSPFATYSYYSDAACTNPISAVGNTTTIYVKYTTNGGSLDLNGGTNYYVVTNDNFLYASNSSAIGIENPITSNADTRKWKITGNDAYQLTLQNVGNSNYINYNLPSSENVTLSGMGSKFFLHQGTSGKYELVAVTNNDFTTTDYYTLGVDNGTLQLYSKTDHPFSDDEVQTSFCKDVASITVNPTAVSLTYTGGDQTLVTAGTALNGTMQYRLGNTGDYSNDIPTAKNAGSYEVYYKAIANSGYVDAIPSSPVTVVISKAPLTITANDNTITYGDDPAGSVEYSGFVNEETASVLGGSLVITGYSQYDDVGTYTITPDGLTSDNYEITFVPGTLTVNPKEVGLTWGNTALNYDGSERVPTVTATGLVNGDEIGVTVTGGQTDIGTGYTATASALTGEKAGNYSLPAENTTEFSIRTPLLTITANDYTISYGDARPNYAVTYEGFVNGDDESVLSGKLTFECEYVRGKEVHTYTITPKGLRSDKYEITFVEGTLTVERKEVGLSWETTELTYTGTAQVPTATATGLVNDDEIGVTVEVTGDHTNVGTSYTATATALTGTKKDNYKLPAVNTTSFSIVKAHLTVTANDHAITYGDAPANDGVTYTGFVNGEDESELTGELAYAYDYNQYDDVVRYNENDEVVPYTITPNGLTSDNYDITFETGTLTVNQKKVTLTWDESSFPCDGSAHAPTPTINNSDIVNSDDVSGVTVTIEANSGSSLTGNQAIQAGYYRAIATLEGTKAGNYKPVPAIQPFAISFKMIGDGIDPAEDIAIVATDGSNVTVTDGGTPLVLNTHYTVVTETEGCDNYITVTGKGNYSGAARVLYVAPRFHQPSGDTEYAAVYRATSDLAKPADIDPYIVKKVNPSVGILTISPVGYLPEGVPVVLVAASNITGFQATAKPDNVAEITAQTKNSNLLKVSPEEGVEVEARQIYLFNAGEFVLTLSGTLPKGYFYLDNPNYHATGTTPGGSSRLQLIIEDDTETGIENSQLSTLNSQLSTDTWYTLDGRKLNGKPTQKGLYIVNGKKVIIR